MDTTLLLMFVATFSSILILPGPNVMFAVGQSLKYGFVGSIYVSLGFMVSTGVQAGLVFSGLGILVSKYASTLFILKWLGVAYLIYLAYKLFRKNGSATKSEEQEMSKSKMFLTAMLFSLTNPKAVLASVLTYPVFISSAYPYIPQAFTLTVCAMAISFSVYGAYSLSASVLKRKVINNKWGNKIVGGLYLMAAGSLANKST